jgi:hypothetical protein
MKPSLPGKKGVYFDGLNNNKTVFLALISYSRKGLFFSKVLKAPVFRGSNPSDGRSGLSIAVQLYYNS